MPIDTPYNRMVTDKYNALIRDKVDHEMDTLQTVLPAPAGFDVNGYNPKVMGSGVGVYHKGDGERAVGSGISATLCGHGNARGGNMADWYTSSTGNYSGYGSARGGANLGLQPAVRVELALGAGLRGNRTSKHGCLDKHEEFNGSGKKDCPLGHEVCSCGSGSARGNARGGFLGIDKLLGLLGAGAESGHVDGGFLKDILGMFGMGSARGNARGGFLGIDKLLGLLGAGAESGHVDGGFLKDILGMFGMGSARGGKGLKIKAPKKSAPKKPAFKPTKKAKKEEPKKEAKKSLLSRLPSFGDTVKGIEEGVKGIEKAVDIGQKIAPIAKAAYDYVKPKAAPAPAQAPAPEPAPDAEAPAGSGKRGVSRRHRHAAVRGVSANGKAQGKAQGKAHGKSRATIVKEIMKKMALPLIEASKYVKAHNLY